MTASADATARVRALYVHIPFCERKCEYCDFTSIAGKPREREYVEALRKELTMLGERLPGIELDTVFFGGGTPSFIEPELLASVLREIRAGFTVRKGAEITLEANPSSIDAERARIWRDAGFNRVSIGVQSLEPDCLQFLGRVHDAERAREAVAEVRAAGFASVNCDLIYAIPGLDDARWRRTLDEVIALRPAHVSCYELTVEPQTPLHTAVRRGQVKPVAARPALRQHWIAVDALAGAGYEQYEISNFAKPGHECRHNLTYWRNGWYLAAGVGAHGHLPAELAQAIGVDAPPGRAVRYWHGRGIAAYIAAVESGTSPLCGTELVDPATHETERFMLGLRLAEGVTLPSGVTSAEVQSLVAEGFVTLRDGCVAVTRRGQEVLDQLVLRIADDVFKPLTTTRPTPQTVG